MLLHKFVSIPHIAHVYEPLHGLKIIEHARKANFTQVKLILIIIDTETIKNLIKIFTLSQDKEIGTKNA